MNSRSRAERAEGEKETRMLAPDIDDAIHNVETLYRTITGKEAPAGEQPFAPIPPEKDPNRHVEEQMNRLMAILGQVQPGAAGAPWIPPVSVWETERETVVCIDVAGVARDELDVAVMQNLLTVSGQRRPPEGADLRLRASERPYGPFRRVLALPPGSATEQLAAHMHDGVLEVRVPRAGHAGNAQRIQVK
jgi:HSP20 family protein